MEPCIFVFHTKKDIRVIIGDISINGYFNITDFSSDLITYDSLDKTMYNHMYGGLVEFRNRLTAIGGWTTTIVEVYTNDGWKMDIIPKITNQDEKYADFTQLVINDTLFVFGKLQVVTLIST